MKPTTRVDTSGLNTSPVCMAPPMLSTPLRYLIDKVQPKAQANLVVNAFSRTRLSCSRSTIIHHPPPKLLFCCLTTRDSLRQYHRWAVRNLDTSKAISWKDKFPRRRSPNIPTSNRSSAEPGSLVATFGCLSYLPTMSQSLPGSSQTMSAEIQELQHEIAFQEVLLESIDDTVVDREAAENEVKEEIRALESQLRALRRRTTTTASQSGSSQHPSSSRAAQVTTSTSSPGKKLAHSSTAVEEHIGSAMDSSMSEYKLLLFLPTAISCLGHQ